MPERPRLPVLALLAATASLASACVLDNPGVAPEPRRFHYPIAAAVAPDSRYLYVVNSDFNLEFSGATVNVVDLQIVRDRIAGCPNGCPVVTTPGHEAQFAPEGAGGLTTVRINPYATDVALRPARGAAPGRLYITVRGDNTLTWIDLTNDGRTLECGATFEAGPCTGRHRVGEDPAQSPRALTLPPLPSALSVDPDGYITIAHQEAPGGRVSLLFDPPGTAGAAPVLVHWTGDLTRSPSALLRINPDAPAGEEPFWYTFSREIPVVSQVRAFPDQQLSFLYQSRAFVMQGLASDVGVRRVVRDPRPGSTMAYATARPASSTTAGRSPEQLLAIDFSAREDPRITNVLTLPPGPSHLTAIDDPAGSGHTLVYAVSFDARKVYVIDTVDWRVVDQVRTQPGPHAIVADPSLAPGGARGADGGPAHPYLYLVSFLSSVVEVIDVGTTPAHAATRHRVVFTIGDPVRPRETL